MDGMTTLDRVLQQAHMVRVSPVSGFGVDGFIWVDLADPAELGQLRAAIAVESLAGSRCMCLGDVRFEVFDPGGERLADVVLHHGATLRWGQWESDAVLVDGLLLLAWLDGHGMPGPMRQFVADLHRAEKETAEKRTWLAAIPAGLDGAADRILALSRTGGAPSPNCSRSSRTDCSWHSLTCRSGCWRCSAGTALAAGGAPATPFTRACLANFFAGFRSPTCSPGWPTHGLESGTTPGPCGISWAGRPARIRSAMLPACPNHCAPDCWRTPAAPETPTSRAAQNGGWHPRGPESPARTRMRPSSGRHRVVETGARDSLVVTAVKN